MKKALILASLCLLVACPAGFTAENEISPETEITSTAIHNGDYTPQLLEKIKAERNTIYNSLNMTPQQLVKKDAIDERRYGDLEPQIKKLCLSRKNLKDLQADKNSDKSKIKSTQKDIESARQEIKHISNKYDKEFKKILTSEQKSKYSLIRKLKRADLKKLEEKHKKESDLRPFGVPVSQAEYTEQQKKKHSLFKNCKKKD